MTVYAAEDPFAQLGVLSFTVRGKPSEDVAEALSRRGIAVRAGYHCAPTAHQSAGTIEHGTVRISVSAFNRAEDIDGFLRVMRAVLAE